MLKLRLTRLGDKKRPSYRIVAMEALSKRDGGAVAYLGNYFPLEDSRVRTVKSILVKAGVWAKFEETKKK